MAVWLMRLAVGLLKHHTSRALGILCASVFAASDLTLETKRMV